MKKLDAIHVFGRTGADLGRAIGVTHKRISQLPDDLGQPYIDRIVGAAVRLGLTDKLPERFQPRAGPAERHAEDHAE